MNGEVVSASLMAMTTGISSFSSMLPEFSEVRKSSASDPQMVNDVRAGEVAAVTLTVGIGVAASLFTKSPTPAVISVIAAVVMVAMYETVLSTHPKEVATNV